MVRTEELLRLVAVEVLKGFEFLYQGLVLVLQHSHTVLQTLDILLLLPATLPGRLSVEEMGQIDKPSGNRANTCWLFLFHFFNGPSNMFTVFLTCFS